MSRKTIYTLIISIFVLLFVGMLFSYIYVGSHNNTTSTGQSSGGVFGTIFSLFNKNSAPLGNTPNPNVVASTTVQADNGTLVVIPRLREVSAAPTAGAAFVQRNISSTVTNSTGGISTITVLGTFIRYVERATGHIFETKPDNLGVKEISNTTMPKIYQATFTNAGNSVLFRYLKDENIETYFGTLISPTATGTATTSPSSSDQPYQLSGKLLPENITDLVLSPGKDQIFSLQSGGQGALGVISLTDYTKQRQIFNNVLKEWLPDWSNSKTIIIVTKPSASSLGYLFYLNTTTGGLTKILGNVSGLTALSSPDLSSILFSASDRSNFTLNLYNPKNGSASGLSLKTLPEKCVWSQKKSGILYCAVPISVPEGSYPDSWYQGSVSFSDNFWQINAKTGDRTLIARPIDLAKINMDAVNLTLDPNENYLMFTNKKDMTLWNLLINQPAPAAAAASST